MNEDKEVQGIISEETPEELQTTEAEESQEAAPASEELPEKFKGKSAAEIARAALEAEKRMHESSTESASIRRRLQETEQRMLELQSQYRAPVQEESDALEDIAKEWDEDPKQATLKGIKRLQESLSQREHRQALEMRQREGAEFYYKEKNANPDFAQRESDMVEFSKKFAHLIRPEFAQSKDVMEALYFMARGARVSDYEKSAIDKAKKQQDKIKEEKRNAVSERSGAASTASSESVGLGDFGKMSQKQQQEELDKLARKIGRM